MQFINVKTGKNRDRFEYKLENQVAFIEYVNKQNTYYLMHTEVPEQLKGKGVASTLTTKAFEYLEGLNAKIVPYCPFIVQFLQKNEEWQKLV